MDYEQAEAYILDCQRKSVETGRKIVDAINALPEPYRQGIIELYEPGLFVMFAGEVAGVLLDYLRMPPDEFQHQLERVVRDGTTRPVV